MDVFKIDQSLSGNLGSAPSPDKITPEVSFDAGSEFNLSFFDTPEDSNTQGFSDPGSVGSTSASSPPPQQLTQLHLPVPGSSTPGSGPSPLLLSPPGASASSSTVTIKQGIHARLTQNRKRITNNCFGIKLHFPLGYSRILMGDQIKY